VNAKSVTLSLLALACAALALGLWLRHSRAVTQHRADERQILLLSNQWIQTRARLDEQIQVSMLQDSNLAVRAFDLKATEAKLASTASTLASTTEALARTETEVRTALEELARRDAKIAELETQREGMTRQMVELNQSIDQLESQIVATEKKLTDSEDNREFLLAELKRLQAEKAELERRLSDLAFLRDQVKKLKEELSIVRRLDWIRRGLYGSTPRKGAELLQAGRPPPPAKTNFNLEAEIRPDGSARIVAPPAPPAKPQPPK
jgi:septal ring factor EnvC (AmiA/AmiB activator)